MSRKPSDHDDTRFGPKPSTDDVMMPCFHLKCWAESTHSRGVWATEGHLNVEYFCAAHAPADATSFEGDDIACAVEDLAKWVGITAEDLRLRLEATREQNKALGELARLTQELGDETP